MRMNFTYTKTENWYLKDTAIENMFIAEYMAQAKGEYVKVYLLAQMYAGLGASEEPRLFANQLGISEETVMDAWDYWERCGLVRKIPQEGAGGQFSIEFISPKEALYCGEDSGKDASEGSPEKAAPAAKAGGAKKSGSVADRLIDREFADILAAIEENIERPLTPTEGQAVESWRTDYGATAETILYAYNYCVNLLGKDNIRYIGKVVLAWAKEGLTDTEKIEAYLAENEAKRNLQTRIFKALGFRRNPTEAESEVMEGWFKDSGFTIEEILDACKKTAGISNPNINYVNSVLEGRRKEGKAGKPPAAAKETITRKTVEEYYEYLRKKAVEETKKRREEIRGLIPRIGELQEELRLVVPQISQALIRKNKSDAQKLREKRDALVKERTELLEKNGYPADYMDDRYYCDECKDTGVRETGERCSCYEKRMSEAKVWQKSLAK